MAVLPERLTRLGSRHLTLRQKEERSFYLFILPWLIGLVLFTGGPVIYSFFISLTNWTGIQTREWVGLDNYINLLTVDPLFWTVMKNTFVYGISSVILGTILSLAVAILMNQKVPGIGIFRTLYYLPAVTSGIASAIMFAWLFNPRSGLINFLLSVVGLEGPTWFSSTAWAMPGLIIVSLWGIGPNMIILLAGLQGIPDQLYEAARIDGANHLQEFVHITVPMLSPVLFYVAVITLIGSFQIFENVLVMTNGGPGTATRVIVFDLYQNAFVNSRMGYASAQAWILCVVIMILTWLMFRFSKTRVHYDLA